MNQLLLLITLTLLIAPTSQAQTRLEDFIANDTYKQVEISTDGQYLAYTQTRDQQDVLLTVRTEDLKLVHVTRLPNKMSVGFFKFISDDRLVFNTVQKIGSLAVPNDAGDWHAVNANGSEPRQIFAHRYTANRIEFQDTLPDQPNQLLMVEHYPPSNKGKGSDLIRIDTMTGDMQTILQGPEAACHFILDDKHLVRYAQCTRTEVPSVDPDHRFHIYTVAHRLTTDNQWQLLWDSSPKSKITIIGITPSGKTQVTLDDFTGPAAAGELNNEHTVFQRQYAHPEVEPWRFIYSPNQKSVISILLDPGQPEAFDLPSSEKDNKTLNSLRAAFPGQIVQPLGSTRDQRQLLFSVSSDRNPSQVYLHDTQTETNRLLLTKKPNLNPDQMATTSPIKVTASDGTIIHGYLTKAQSNNPIAPVVVLVHGGPIAVRDHWQFETERQLLASNGFTVLQVNYRGSAGYGKAFADKANGNWSDTLIDDINESTQWLIDQGLADPKRICIVGASFGAYAAMMAVIKRPTLYRCVAGQAGPYSTAITLSHSDISQSEFGVRYLQQAIGNTPSQQDKASAVLQARHIKIPVYLAAGEDDPRCPIEHTYEMTKQLTAAGNPPQTLIIPDEKHGFQSEPARALYYTQLLAFLKANLD